MSEFTKRILRPVALPVAALGVITVMVFGGSRILLAVPEYWSVGIALAIAATIMFYASVLSAVPTVKPSQRGLAVVLAVAVMGAGGWGLGKGIREIEAHGGGGIPIVAKGIAWEQTELTVPADTAFEIAVDNQDAGIPHNLSIYADDSFASVIHEGEIFSGVSTLTEEIEPLAAGEYAYRCDVHPLMIGTMTASADFVADDHGAPSGDGH
jgi:hypothetical protein